MFITYFISKVVTDKPWGGGGQPLYVASGNS